MEFKHGGQQCVVPVKYKPSKGNPWIISVIPYRDRHILQRPHSCTRSESIFPSVWPTLELLALRSSSPTGEQIASFKLLSRAAINNSDNIYVDF